MCKKNTVAYGDYIGKRMVGWCVYNGKDFSFLSDKQVKAKIKAGDLVNGLALDTEGNVVIDQTFTKSLMGKSGLNFSPITAEDDTDDDIVMNKYYALVKVAGNQYHFITNRCGYEVFTEEQLKAMLSIMPWAVSRWGLMESWWYIRLWRSRVAEWARASHRRFLRERRKLARERRWWAKCSPPSLSSWGFPVVACWYFCTYCISLSKCSENW
jgi:hypothetical protein